MESTRLTGEISLAYRTRNIKRSALQEMLSVTSRPGILSFALGLPAAELFPAEGFARAAAQVLADDPRALQYAPPYGPLKQHIVSLMAHRGVGCRVEQVFLTTGAQQGMSLLVQLLLDTGGQVLVERLSYTGFHQAIEPFGPDIITVPTDLRTGMDVDAVESLLAAGHRPAFIFAVTDGNNPLGVSISLEKRLRLVDLARRYRIPIMEDDAYGFLHYENAAVPPMRAFDDQWVFYLGSFSKILAPNLRVGWVIVPESLTEKLSILKEASDINTTTFAQRVISTYLDAGLLPDHIATLRREYRTRRDKMLGALRQHFPREARWTNPASGLFIWVELNADVDAGELLKIAVETERTAYIPGHAFDVGGNRSAANCLRLNFSNCSPQQIEDGIARLARVLKGVAV